jgi:hypothetical protein
MHGNAMLLLPVFKTAIIFEYAILEQYSIAARSEKSSEAEYLITSLVLNERFATILLP